MLLVHQTKAFVLTFLPDEWQPFIDDCFACVTIATIYEMLSEMIVVLHFSQIVNGM